MSQNAKEKEVITVIRQMEGAENNAFVTKILLNIFEDVILNNPGHKDYQYDVMMGALLEINKNTFAEYEQHMLLPEEDQDYLLSGALSAQENFYHVLNMAYADELAVSLEERIQMVRDVMNEQIQEVEDMVAEPLAEIRAAIEKQKGTQS